MEEAYLSLMSPPDFYAYRQDRVSPRDAEYDMPFEFVAELEPRRLGALRLYATINDVEQMDASTYGVDLKLLKEVPEDDVHAYMLFEQDFWYMPPSLGELEFNLSGERLKAIGGYLLEADEEELGILLEVRAENAEFEPEEFNRCPEDGRRIVRATANAAFDRRSRPPKQV